MPGENPGPLGGNNGVMSAFNFVHQPVICRLPRARLIIISVTWAIRPRRSRKGKKNRRVGRLGFFLCSSFSGMIYSFFVISSLSAASYALPYFCFVYCWPWRKKPTSTVWSIFFYVLFPYSNILHITVSVAVSAYFTFIHLHPSFLFLFGGVDFACLAPHVFAKGDAFGAGPLHNGFIFFLAKSNRALNPLICGRFAPRIEALTAFGCHMVRSFNTYIRREYNQFPGCRKAFP